VADAELVARDTAAYRLAECTSPRAAGGGVRQVRAADRRTSKGSGQQSLARAARSWAARWPDRTRQTRDGASNHASQAIPSPSRSLPEFAS
jgi:hypothetical protein